MSLTTRALDKPPSLNVRYSCLDELPSSSSGLGHRPFTPAAGVRIPMRAPRFGDVAQWESACLTSRRSQVQTLPFPPRGVGTWCSWLACRSVTPVVASSSLVVPANAEVAQVVEQWTENPRVPGSTPGLGTREVLWCDKEKMVFAKHNLLFVFRAIIFS